MITLLRLEHAAPLGVLDHRQPDAVLDAAAGVGPLELEPDLDLLGSKSRLIRTWGVLPMVSRMFAGLHGRGLAESWESARRRDSVCAMRSEWGEGERATSARTAGQA